MMDNVQDLQNKWDMIMKLADTWQITFNKDK